ncbi:MAG: hypothetical protein V1725_02660 [archaeon]
MDDYSVQAITGADITASLVSGTLYDELRKQPATWVSARQLKSGNGLIISDGFSRCQGVVFCDGMTGAIAHNHPEEDPFYTVTGRWAGEGREDPRHIFSDLTNVKAVHVYHESNYAYPRNWIEDPLNAMGITDIQHIPIKAKNLGRNHWRHLVLDAQQGLLYVFPTDHKRGLKIKI